jgi:predicted nuclease of predicted toxin-antitoxin system
MKLLLDNNLSQKLVSRLASIFPDASHVALVGLDAATDNAVWEHARQNDLCIVSKDSDFNDLLAAKGFPPKVIWIHLGNCTTTAIAELLERHNVTIKDFMESEDNGLLELQ